MNQTDNIIILVGDTSNFSSTEEYILKHTTAKVFSLDFLSHKLLTKKKFSHEIGENFLNDDDFLKIDELARHVSINWHQNSEIKNFLEFKGINLGELFETELFQYLLPLFINALTIEHILSILNPKKVISSTSINEFVKQICNDKGIEFVSIEKKQETALVLDNLQIKINLGKYPISVKISRKRYLSLKKLFEKYIILFLGLNEKQFDKKSILLVDFNPILYEDLLNNLSIINKNILLLNTRRPAVWNFHSLKIISRNKCKLISLSMYEKKILEQINYTVKSFNIKQQELWKKNHVFEDIFSINSFTLWDSIKNSFKQICVSRFSESIKLILLMNELLPKIHPSVILEWAETASEEKVIIQIAKKLEINSTYLQHTLAAIEDSSTFTGRFVSHFAHSFLSSKQAVWGIPAKEYALSNNNKNTMVVGSPRHDKFFNFVDTVEKKGIILFAPTFPSGMSSKNITTEAIETFNEFIQQTCKILKNIPNKEFIVKPHPTPSAVYDIAKLVKDIDPDISITYEQNILNVISKCELVITTNNSTVAIDSMMLNKPVISLQTKSNYMNDEIVKMDAVISVTKISDIESTIKKLIKDNAMKKDLLKRSKIFLDFHFANQGTASKHLSTILDQF